MAITASSGVDYDYLFKVILIGDANVGKSSLISQFCNEKFMDTVASTVGVDFYIKDFIINEKRVKVSSTFLYAILNTALHEQFMRAINVIVRE